VSSPISAASRLLDESIGDITSALGDPTRRAVFIAAREAAGPVTSADIAELFLIHPNVARHHLDKLAADGYLDVTRRRQTGRSGPGAGRPAKCYTASGKGIDLHFPSRRQDLLVELLVRIIERTSSTDIAAIAESVGREYGEELAEEIGSPGNAEYTTAVTAVARAMTGLGFQMSADPGAGRLTTSSCPFGDAAAGHPEVLCSLDRGIVSGLFEGMNQPCAPILHPDLDEACITEVPVSITSR
jgi:predicted ArsR family transcriptional regulator